MPLHLKVLSATSESKLSPKPRKRARKDDTTTAEEAADKDHVTATTTTTGRCVNVADRYDKVGRVGAGTYGIVYKAKDRLTGNYVALKRCIPHHESSDGFPITTLREIQSLRLCAGHPNIVALETVAVSRSGVFLVFQYCEHDIGDLIDSYYAEHRKSPFPQAAVKTLLRQLLGALEFLHGRNLIHRDVKANNLLYTNKGCLKLADFGLSRPYADHHHGALLTPTVASLWYRPPELLLGATTYTQASLDIWATGCIFGELLQGCPLANGKDEIDQMDKVVQCLGVPTVADWPDLYQLPLLRNNGIQFPPSSRRTLLDTFGYLSDRGLQLLTTMLQYNPAKRWTAAKALTSAYFEEGPLPTPCSDMPRFKSLHEKHGSSKKH
jgi:serine/threonine protein kinase